MKKILVTLIAGALLIIGGFSLGNAIKFRAKLLMVELGSDLTINKKVMQILAKKRI